MVGRTVLLVALIAATIGYLQVQTVEAVPVFARQYDMQCNACHARTCWHETR